MLLNLGGIFHQTRGQIRIGERVRDGNTDRLARRDTVDHTEVQNHILQGLYGLFLTDTCVVSVSLFTILHFYIYLFCVRLLLSS